MELILQFFPFLLLLGPPTFLVKPKSQTVKAGGIATFFCSASGSPPPHIYWRKNNKKITQSQPRFFVTPYKNGTRLRIEPVRAGRDNMEFECLAENGVGDAVMATATLTVHEVLEWNGNRVMKRASPSFYEASSNANVQALTLERVTFNLLLTKYSD
ncbi:hypothetical protein QAD02_015020 [Eretmocerus hayati]|uniref:Uncharacterized protein n=1 Tax=Eretmocerus hayati TaxID=131215 RepID=A0ACC2P7Z2_9HYME|nr:hypothetical protein QAD02_015020 [Eretmocerus hayati]